MSKKKASGAGFIEVIALGLKVDLVLEDELEQALLEAHRRTQASRPH